MEIKVVRKIAVLSLRILLGGIALGSISSMTLASMTLAQETKPSLPLGTNNSPTIQVPSHSSQEPDFSETKPSQTGVKAEIPWWLWAVLGGLTAWNLILSYLVWKNFENFDQKTRKNEKKIQDLEAKSIALNHRIDRKVAPLDDLARKIESIEKNLLARREERSQSSPTAQAVNTSTQTKIQPSDQDYNPFSNSGFSQSGNYILTPSIPTESWESIAQNYNSSPQLLETYIVEKVSETEESLTNRRNSSNAPVLLKHTNNANYWIFNIEDQTSWLVPKSDLKLTPISYDTFQALFECQDYQPNLKLQILKPAKVSFNSSTSAWELSDKGQVQFTR